MGRGKDTVRTTYLAVRALCHATESIEKVRSSLRVIISADNVLSESTASGHFGNPITIMEGRVTTIRAICAVISRLPADTPVERASRGSAFIIKLDKAAALGGNLVPGDKDPIVLKVGIQFWDGPPAWDDVLALVKERVP